MIGIVPSTIAADHTRLGEQLREAEAADAKHIQVDVMDGHFVPMLTVEPILVEAAPRSTTLPIEAHLMVDHPERFIDDFVNAGADIIILHQESTSHLHRLVQQIKFVGKQADVALNPATPLALFEDILPPT
jgi:ribulose-phosphate 3-epimerase